MNKLRNNQAGTAHLAVMLVILVLVVVGLVGWRLLENQDNKKLYNTDGTPATTQTQTEGSEAESMPESITIVDSEVAKEGNTDWTTISSTSVKLLKWDVSITIPENMVNKAQAAYDTLNDRYVFTHIKITTTESCIQYFTDRLQSTYPGPGLEVSRIPQTKLVYGYVETNQAKSETQTLAEYYSENKETDGYYFLGANNRKFWKSGENYFVAWTIPSIYTSSNFKTACPDVPNSFETSIVDSLKTLR